MAGGTLGRAGQTSVKSEPNVVPMIDIMLVLLIIFMIVTPLIAAGFKATLPKGKNLDPRPEGEPRTRFCTSRRIISSSTARFRRRWRPLAEPVSG
jgi:biopolymer transport protein ExbD